MYFGLYQSGFCVFFSIKTFTFSQLSKDGSLKCFSKDKLRYKNNQSISLKESLFGDKKTLGSFSDKLNIWKAAVCSGQYSQTWGD